MLTESQMCELYRFIPSDGRRVYNSHNTRGGIWFDREGNRPEDFIVVPNPDVHRITANGVLLAATNKQRKESDFMQAELIEVVW